MPRVARKQSSSSLYHVINRGAGKQIIFEDDADKAFFLKRLDTLLDETSGRLIAFCLMDNHFHLLLEIAYSELSSLMHRLQTGYAGYFNRVHEHTGALFGTRFKSEPVETDEYLMTVVRYIHENPVKACLPSGLRYPWSSYGEYVGTPHYVDPSLVLSTFGSVGQFRSFHETKHDDDSCIDFPDVANRIISDDRALQVATDLLGDDTVLRVKGMPRTERNAALAMLRRSGPGVRQIQRLTGVSPSVISRATKEAMER